MGEELRIEIMTGKMNEVRIEKVTVNIGVGQTGNELEKAQKILEKLTESKAVQTICKVKIPGWNIREGLPIGVKVTLRKAKAAKFLKEALAAKDNELKERSFDKLGNFGFGVKEYIDLPTAKYDPQLGIRGFDVLVTLEKAGYRIKKRKLLKGVIGKKQVVSKPEAIEYMKKNFNVKVV